MKIIAVSHTFPQIVRGKMPPDNKMVDDLRMTFTATTEDHQTHEFLVYCSYKKHLVSSYRTNDGYQPRISEHGVNSITSLGETAVTQCFDVFGNKLEAAMLAEGDAIDASLPAHEYDCGNGIHFRSDTDWKVNKFRPLHSFPTLPTGVASTTIFNLTGQNFSDFIYILKFLWSSGETLTVEDKTINRRGVDNTVRIVKTNLAAEIGSYGKAQTTFRRLLTIDNLVWNELQDRTTVKSAWGKLAGAAWFFALTTENERAALLRKLKSEQEMRHRHLEIKQTV